MPRISRLIDLRLFLLFVSSCVAAFGRGWAVPTTSRHNPSYSSSTELHYDPPFRYLSEVVGAEGRVGSFWLCFGDAAASVPRGMSPGCWTTVGCPIYVATPSAAWPQIWNQTLEQRRQDLVFVGNGIPPLEWEDATVIVPHFAVLNKCQINEPCVSTNPQSPPTYLYGRHATNAARILQTQGVPTKILESYQDIQQAAALKLLWASCMWLMCHSVDPPMTVAQVHNERQEELDNLVDDMYPVLLHLVGKMVNRSELDDYLRAYSFSIADAIPSRDLALAELEGRNGVWLSRRSERHPQTLHQQLIQVVAGTEALDRVLSQTYLSSVGKSIKKSIHVNSIGLVCWGKDDALCPVPTRIVIVGGGIIGSSLALFLAERRRDLNIIVLDQLPPESVGRTTPASWAWLNANTKSPKSYQILNQLGLHAWKHEPHLRGLVSWMGSLVRFAEPPQFVNDGGYPAEGPLSHDRIKELEPLADWKLYDEDGSIDEGYTYFFRDEGCVDPNLAVATLRKAAVEKGVQFLGNANVTSVTRDPVSGKICGVTVFVKDERMTMSADVVVVAAGAGSGSKSLGCGFQLLHRPGAIACAIPNQTDTNRLSRILVDPFRSSHVLQRPDGTIVVGGGALEVGGKVGTVTVSSKIDNISTHSLLEGVKSLCPYILDDSVVGQTYQAVRPMPKDGLPIIGYVEEGLYTVVTHSGMTLGPLLSSLAAAEVMDGISFDLLSSYRPSRFRDECDANSIF